MKQLLLQIRIATEFRRVSCARTASFFVDSFLRMVIILGLEIGYRGSNPEKSPRTAGLSKNGFTSAEDNSLPGSHPPWAHQETD